MNQEEIVQRLSAYIDPSIIEEILNRSDMPEEEAASEEVVMLFADIRGFTSLAQKISPTLLISLLDDFLELTGRCIHRNHGIIDKFMGDCTMAYWRVKNNPDALYTVCRTALEIQKEAKVFVASVLEKTGSEIGIGIGIHAGPALLCHVGNKEYRAYTVLGSTVNTACRLEEYAPPGVTYISQESASLLGDRIQIEVVPQMQRRRGRDISVTMAKLIGLTEEREEKR